MKWLAGAVVVWLVARALRAATSAPDAYNIVAAGFAALVPPPEPLTPEWFAWVDRRLAANDPANNSGG